MTLLLKVIGMQMKCFTGYLDVSLLLGYMQMVLIHCYRLLTSHQCSVHLKDINV